MDRRASASALPSRARLPERNLGAMVVRMAIFERAGVTLHYEEHGQGFALLLLAPGGMRASAAFWARAPFDPIREFSAHFRVIALDERNAGRSRAPISEADGWHSYTADHLALLDHLGVSRCLLLGGCIGGAYALDLIAAAPQRVAAAVLQQPIGHTTDNREVFYKLFDDWQAELAPLHPDVSQHAWQAFRERMYGGDFVFSVAREQVRGLATPLLVLMGNDVYHPSATSREIVELAAHATLIEQWKDPALVPETVRRVRAFLLSHAQ
jgi:pimeloyl-ACP methyl ester carboxylesterase